MVKENTDAKQEAKAESALQKANHGDMQAFSKELSSMSPKELRDCAQRINRLSAEQEQHNPNEHLPVVAISFDSDGHFAGSKVFKDGEQIRYDDHGVKEQSCISEQSTTTSAESKTVQSASAESRESTPLLEDRVDDRPPSDVENDRTIEVPELIVVAPKPSRPLLRHSRL